MTLKELMKNSVTLPLTVEMEKGIGNLWEPTIYQRNAPPDRQWVADLPKWPSETPPPLAVLIVHCVNNFTYLMEALTDCAAALQPSRNQEEREALAKACVALAMAKEVK